MASGAGARFSYHDATIREADVELLDEPNWVNDNLILFWMQYLEHEIYTSWRQYIEFVGPTVVQLVKLKAALNVQQELKSLKLNQKSLIFLPVNDSEEMEQPGGTHWSLLVFVRSRFAFEHYDSFKGHNFGHAESIARALAPLLALNEVRVIECACLQQRNAYDCGLHVMYNIEQICAAYVTTQTRRQVITSLTDRNDFAHERACALANQAMEESLTPPPLFPTETLPRPTV
ncbi:sentrin-specific protease 8-like [Haemaphysalis longicornis]